MPGVGKHVQDVELGLAGVQVLEFGRPECLVVQPVPAPSRPGASFWHIFAAAPQLARWHPSCAVQWVPLTTCALKAAHDQ